MDSEDFDIIYPLQEMIFNYLFIQIIFWCLKEDGKNQYIHFQPYFWLKDSIL